MQSSSQKTRKRRRSARAFAWFLAVASLLCATFVAAAAYYVMRPTKLRIAVPVEEVRSLGVVAGTFARNRDPVRLSIAETADEPTAIESVMSKKAELAVARSDATLPADLMAVAILRKEFLVIWSAPHPAPTGKSSNKKIEDIKQLSGRRVAVLGGGADGALFKLALREAGVAADRVEIAGTPSDATESAIRDARNDAFVAVGGLTSKALTDAIALTARLRGEPRVLAIEGSEAISKKFPGLASSEIPSNTFGPSPPRPSDAVETLSVDKLIVAPKRLDGPSVVALSRQLFENRPALLREAPSLASLEKPDTDKDSPVPPHPGAAAYIEGSDRTFLERYSDLIWAAVLLLSGLGSSGAWLRSYLKREERDQYLKARDRVLELVTSARAAADDESLAALQRQADDILERTLEYFEDGAIGNASLLALGLVLEQFHYAVSDRRQAMAQAGWHAVPPTSRPGPAAASRP